LQPNLETSESLFKGIALFTPGGGLVYCIDQNKQSRWHLQLCALLQDLFGLMEPPHFLVPCYTATVDRWLDPYTQQIQTVAEAAPLVLRYQALLNAVFGTGDLIWQPTCLQEGICDPVLMATYRHQAPALWEPHDFVVQYEKATADPHSNYGRTLLLTDPTELSPTPTGYVFRLFVSGHSVATERTLQTLHQILEQALCPPYTLKVIDVSQHPELAERDQVSATPTLVKVWPRPVRRIVGNLDTVDQLLRVLGPIDADESSSPKN